MRTWWPRIVRLSTVCLLLALPSDAQTPPGAAQDVPVLTGAVLKGRAPVSEEVLHVSLPRPEETGFDNGLHLMVLEDRRVPTVSFQMTIIGAGGYYDPSDHPGLAGFTASLMREGTAARSAVQIAEDLETLAARVNVSTGMSLQAASLSGSSLTEHVDQVLELAADILLNPSFPEDELARFKDRRRAGLVQQRTRPGFLAVERLARAVYGSHPAARVSPTPESLDQTTRDDLVEFHRAHYTPDHAVLAIAGDISMDEAREKIERFFGGWKASGAPEPTVDDPEPIGAAQVYLVDRENSVQTNLAIGTQGINRTSPDYDALTLTNQIIGGGPTGRLFLNLREDKGYTYGAYSSFTALRYRGDWDASTEVRSEVTNAALGELLGELTRIREELVPEREFADAKRSIVAGFALSLESPMAVLGNYVVRYLYDLPDDYWDRYPERIMAITPEVVRDTAITYLAPNRLQIVAVGNGDEIKAMLAPFGPLEVYDTEGNLAEAVGSGR